MREFLKTRGFKMTPQRELIFRAFFDSGRHVTVDELYERVRGIDSSIGHSTVWRNLKLICKVGLAEEVNLGDGITRYDRITDEPHGHLYCIGCKKLIEFDVDDLMAVLDRAAENNQFSPTGYKVEIQGYCPECQARRKQDMLKESAR